ncbi:E3 ubiquitin-protein ligase LRSAM1-like protein [Dinothrombium tinctorium]|uniref:E3 ubiquitin-protein ligase LRSAM1-like protein n=1 Tax=Dinothrombium tinctorium TaxID=1965070 RepID=A0A3S3NY07_9ACAR|nr:E3 ubiquitin-protein ligase LRSAM1-like protein [Dinothrombium tinctorium]RWS11392.1 E3 ubiquitin-protein ligase LRSAM1-like protein [Dinothrombium tinctorium]RWS11395.1 E3 ubiquitin-protein ligase LRSAM1-like protein [Dinothrombium tinctorium]
MFLRKFVNKDNESKERILEHKMHISQSNPAPVFDLSDCRLSQLPSGVYIMCKVYRKDRLILSNNLFNKIPNNESNRVEDLRNLKYLNFSFNRLTKITSKISFLIELEELHLNSNKLKALPESLSQLKNLKVIDLNDNCFESFPSVLTQIRSLNVIRIRNNDKVKQLPLNLVHLKNLVVLEIDTTVGDLNETSEEESKVEMSGKDDDSDNETYAYEVKINTNKAPSSEEKKKKLLECEKQLQDDISTQQSLLSASEMKKKVLLSELYSEQMNVAKDLEMLQLKKVQNKASLIKTLCLLENHSNNLINYLNRWEARRLQQKSILDEIEENHKRLQKSQVSLKKNAVVKAMQHCLQDSADDRTMQLLLKNKEANQEMVREQLLREQTLQKEAFEMLQRERDQQHRFISNQIKLIEKGLLALTQAEMQRKSHNLDAIMTNVCEQRTYLASCLAQLLKEKENRESVIHNFVENLEEERSAMIDRSENNDFWLLEYQRAMNDESLENQLRIVGVEDENVQQILIDCGEQILPYMHLFAAPNVTFDRLLQMNEKELIALGIDSYDIAQMITQAVQKREKVLLPSAPPCDDDDEAAPSAPPLIKYWYQVECVICLNNEVSI